MFCRCSDHSCRGHMFRRLLLVLSCSNFLVCVEIVIAFSVVLLAVSFVLVVVLPSRFCSAVVVSEFLPVVVVGLYFPLSLSLK